MKEKKTCCSVESFPSKRVACTHRHLIAVTLSAQRPERSSNGCSDMFDEDICVLDLDPLRFFRKFDMVKSFTTTPTTTKMMQTAAKELDSRGIEPRTTPNRDNDAKGVLYH
jgi:hypothetical protein